MNDKIEEFKLFLIENKNKINWNIDIKTIDGGIEPELLEIYEQFKNDLKNERQD